MLLSSIIEIFTIASIIPFLTLLTQPDRVLEYEFIISTLSNFGIQASAQITIAITSIFIIFLINSSLIRISNVYLNGKVAAGIANFFNIICFKNNLYLSYEKQIHRNVNELITAAATQVDIAGNSQRYFAFINFNHCCQWNNNLINQNKLNSNINIISISHYCVYNINYVTTIYQFYIYIIFISRYVYQFNIHFVIIG